MLGPGTGAHPLTAASGRVEIAPYLVGGDYHRFHGRTAADIALLGIGDDVSVWVGLSMQNVIDNGNDITFRLVRLYYEVPRAVDWRVGPGVLRAGFRHPCSHGTDVAVSDRILIRSNVVTSYAFNVTLEPVILGGEVLTGVTMIGQNDDPAFEPHMLLSVVARVMWHVADRWRLLAGVGLGVAVIGSEGDWVYTVADPWHDLSGA